jgi:hypothetical protein
LANVEIPIYSGLYRDGSRIKPSPDSNSKLMLVDINYNQLRRLNSHGADIKDYQIIFSNQGDQASPQTDVTISGIDPLYSQLSNQDK